MVELIDLLSFCLSATYLSFQAVFSSRRLGSPISVTVANLVMNVEDCALSLFGALLLFWSRYVDNTCTAVISSRLDDLHHHLDSTEPSIQFTYEVESGWLLSFLDIHLHHQADGSIITSVFWKATHTNKYLNFRVLNVLRTRVLTQMAYYIANTHCMFKHLVLCRYLP